MGNPVKRLTQILVIAALALATLPTMAVVVDTTGSYGITRTNFPETVPTEIVALDLTGKTLANGTLEVIEVITPDGPDREWVEFIFSTPQRAPLANFFDQLWQVDILGIPTVAPSAIDGLIAYFPFSPPPKGLRLPTFLISCGRSIFLAFQPLRRLLLMV